MEMSHTVLLAPLEINSTNFPLPNSLNTTAWSSTGAFATNINTRDRNTCVVCGYKIRQCIDHAHIIPRTDHEQWQDLCQLGLIPLGAKTVNHESRNGILLCKNHHYAFDAFYFYIRYMPERMSYVFVNHSQVDDLAQWHDVDIRLDPDNPRAPWPVLFAIHERSVRAKRILGVSEVTMPGPLAPPDTTPGPSQPEPSSTSQQNPSSTIQASQPEPSSTSQQNTIQASQADHSYADHPYTLRKVILEPLDGNLWEHFNPEVMKAQGFRNFYIPMEDE